ncbi:MAG TPA: spermidine/putrescine ABC transporter substrate-binding protein [Bryobacteraceae bacterium]|nr:spermidine/putrescine ABC transporter substrate-binding protein [Bryobacteraceae bacterium]
MNRRTLLIGAAASAAGCARGPRLNVYNWSDYIAPDTIAQFEQETGIYVRYGTYESVQEMLAKVMSGNSGWDVVFPSNAFIQPMRQMGLLAPLRREWLSHLDALDPAFRQPPWDPGLHWSVPYMWGVTGVLYQTGLHPPPLAWRDLWDARMAGKITMLDDEEEVLGACLKMEGYSWNSENPAELRQAQRQAIAQKRLLRAYVNAEVRDQLVAGDVTAAQAWAVTAAQAIQAAAGKLAFAFPAEGFGRYCDNMAILRESRRQQAAHRFIDYLLRPSVSAQIASAAQTATANGAARQLLPPSLRDNPVLYPSEEVLARAEWGAAQSPESQKLRDRLWTEIKSA